MPKRVAIVGGGITGLAAAFELERHASAEVDLYEAGSRLGGKIGTEQFGQMTVETGPDCFFARKPGVMETVRELGLEDQMIEPLQAEFSILHEGELHRVPRGLTAFGDLFQDVVDSATFLSEEAKAQVMAEPMQARGGLEDESIRSFFTRRFGSEFARLLAEPLLASTHGGDPARLSMKALYPGYLELERGQGSLGAPGKAKPSVNAGPTFLSFRNGMQTLVDALAGSLTRTRVHVQRSVECLDELEADRVLLAVPSHRAAIILETALPETARWMTAIQHKSSAIVTFAFARGSIGDGLSGTGFLVPTTEDSEVTGATWTSNKWAHRAPADEALIRIFLRSDGVDFAELSDAELCRKALHGIAPLLSIQGLPSQTRVVRWVNALPQYELGHLERVAAIESSLGTEPTLFVAGTSYRGVGIPDCLRQGREVACRILETL